MTHLFPATQHLSGTDFPESQLLESLSRIRYLVLREWVLKSPHVLRELILKSQRSGTTVITNLTISSWRQNHHMTPLSLFPAPQKPLSVRILPISNIVMIQNSNEPE